MPPSYGDIYFPDEIISRYVRVKNIPYFKLSKASITSVACRIQGAWITRPMAVLAPIGKWNDN